MSKFRRALPLGPLLVAYRARRAEVAPTDAVRSARSTWLNEPFLDRSSPAVLAESLLGFYRAVVPVPWHEDVVARRGGMIRHGLSHLLRGQDAVGARLARCAVPGGPYHVPGLGPAFWSAAAKALDPDRYPLWSPTVAAGLARVGLVRPDAGHDLASSWTAAAVAYEVVLTSHPDLLAADLDAFFVAVANLEGRELGSSVSPADRLPDAIAQALRELRTRTPLKKRSAEYAAALTAVRETFESQLERHPSLAKRLKLVRTPDDLPGALADDPAVIDLGLGVIAGLLHLRHPARFPAWSEGALPGLAVLDDAFSPALDPLDQYHLLCEVAAGLRQRSRVHPCEVLPLLETLGSQPADRPPEPARAGWFGGFCSDTFHFLADLAGHNRTGWMAAERNRYRFAVREPLVELCDALAARYVRPVLGGEYGWELETDPRPGRALTSITRTDFGRGGPYAPVLWVTFARKRPGPRREDVQFFARLDPAGVAVGFRLGRRARDAGRRLRKNVQEHGELLFAALRATGAIEACTWGEEVGPDRGRRIRTAADLRAWATGKELAAFRWFPHDAAVLRSDELVGEALILFDRLVPLFAAAVEDDPRPVLHRRAGTPDGGHGFDRAAFRAVTHLSDVWLTRALDLLKLKKQLVLQGVPGTGKTHVARSLARLLTGGRADGVRLVQFHPGYSYEEFVEGIRPRAVESNGQSAVTYPVEPGLLATFADRAVKHPSDPHVLVIDELNRGNLPRVFGELLFLLEYRDQEVTLPYSKGPFRLPTNLYVIATMNPADRSAVPIDQAVRRRFSFIDMAPDPALLARWLDEHPPADPDPRFGARLVRWFEALNRRLARDLGSDRQVGHSFFMVPDLTAAGLRAVWDHHVRPALDDLYPGRPDRVKALDPARTFDAKPRRARPASAD
ncbi:MAG TPA: DUF2461 family protein [Fimbriiglobus sp.]|nr:DUF2461 family protein [Fimbriiglobus sp.]